MSQIHKTFSHVRRLVKVFLGVPISIIAFIFIFKIIFDSRVLLLSSLQHIQIYPLLMGILFLLLYFFLRSTMWKILLEKEGHVIESDKNILLYSFSELKRYVPGSIFSFAARINHYQNSKIPPKVTIKLLFTEGIIIVLASLCMSIPAILYLSEQLTTTTVLVNNYASSARITGLVVLLVISLLILLIFSLKFIIKHNNKIQKIITSNFEIFFLGCLAWFFFGVGNFLITYSFTELNLFRFSEQSSLFILSWLIGYLTLITPMGLGVREGVLSAALSINLPLYLATAAALVSRIFLIISELLFLLLAYLFTYQSFFKKIFSFLKKYKYNFLLCLSVLLYMVYFSYVTIEKHNNFYTGRFDLGNMDQTVWNTLHGRIFTLTNPDSTNVVSRLGTHADFILILLAPFYVIWQDPRMLLILQTIILGCGAFFVYALSEQILSKTLQKNSKKISFLLSLSFLLNPSIQRQNLYDFHSVTLATTFLLGMFYFLQKYLEKKNLNTFKSIYSYNFLFFFIFLILALITKENLFALGAIVGVYLFFKKHRKIGGLITIVCIIAAYLLVSVFIPHARGGQNHFAVSYFSELGDSPIGILKTLIFNPVKIMQEVFTVENLEYLKTITLSTGFLSFLYPFPLLFSLPDLAVNLLSQNKNLKSINFQYAATIIPFIYISSIYGIRFVVKKMKTKFRIHDKTISSTIFYYLLIFSIITTWTYGVLPGSAHPAIEMIGQKFEEREEVSNFISKIPSNFSVAATNNIGAHLSHREKIYTIPNGIDQADIVLFLLNDVYAQPSLKSQIEFAENMKKDKNYIQVFETGPFVAFERRKLDTAQKLSLKKPEIYPYSISSLNKRTYHVGQITIEKTLKENKDFTTYLAFYLSDGFKIYTTLTIPQSISSHTNTVLLLHGLISHTSYNSETSYTGAIEYYAKKGYIVLKPDYRGYGLSEADSELTEQFAYPVDVLNLLSSLASLENLKFNDIYILGDGTGSEVALKVLEVTGFRKEFTSMVKKAVLLNPIFDATELYSNSNNKELANRFLKIQQEIGSPEQNPAQWQEISSINFLQQIKVPVLILQESSRPRTMLQSNRLYSTLLITNPDTKYQLVTTKQPQNREVLPISEKYFGSSLTLP